VEVEALLRVRRDDSVFGANGGTQAVAIQMARVLRPGGRLQIGDLVVQKPVPESAKKKIELWTG
jgi:hypothetical protein